MRIFFGKNEEKNLKKIYIARHAKAIKDENMQDFERKLSESGKEDLKRLFQRLQVYDIKPDSILSSPSKRTAKTAKKIAKFYNLDKKKIQFLDELYLGDAVKIYNILQTIDKRYNEIFLVGHNPTLIELCELLGFLCLTSFPTSSVLCLEFDIEDFKDLKEHSGKLIFFEHVRKLKE